ncbi:cytochrome P450 [Streptomyces sp. NPDC047072]|uniref:cytochrome P450 n=1 Tax=Streptomyces sp. NPDC047072 TaxID=3154809 RepID=UPI0033C756E7
MSATLVYDPLAAQTLEDPYPLYARLRENSPVFWHEQMSSWVVTRHADCVAVLRDHGRFARDRRRAGAEVPEHLQNLQSLDPPGLSPLKRVLVGALRAQDLTAIGERARELTARLLTELAGRQTFDWIHLVAAPVALAVSADLFGVPEPDLTYYSTISDRIARRMDAGLNPETIPLGDAARADLNSMVEGWFAGDERPGVLSAVRAAADRAQLPPHFIRNSVSNMFNASYGTLFAAIGNIALTLLHHPEALGQLRADHALLETAPDELVRFDGPAQGTSRVAVEHTEIAGRPIEPGQIVMTLFGAANRDPREFAHPDELLLARSPNRHLGFGWGMHSCLGTVFGNLAIREVLRALMEAPDLRLAGRPVRRTTATVRSMDLLPVTFHR